MKTKGISPKDFVVGLLKRSDCSVQVAACLSDKTGIHAWGWNSAGMGFGEHAEIACLRRSNFKRVAKSVMWVAAKRRKSTSIVIARPCAACWSSAKQCRYIVYRRKGETWEILDPSRIP